MILFQWLELHFHEALGVFGAGRVIMRPASEGNGIVDGGAVRTIFELAGINDVLAKSLGTSTPINMVRATFEGLKSIRTVEEVAALRGLSVEDIL